MISLRLSMPKACCWEDLGPALLLIAVATIDWEHFNPKRHSNPQLRFKRCVKSSTPLPLRSSHNTHTPTPTHTHSYKNGPRKRELPRLGHSDDAASWAVHHDRWTSPAPSLSTSSLDLNRPQTQRTTNKTHILLTRSIGHRSRGRLQDS